MKRLLFFAAVLAFASSAYAQSTPEAFLGLVPPLPNQCCSQKHAEKTAYLARVDESIKQLDAEIERRQKEANANLKQNEERIKAYTMAQTGVSPADIQKLKSMTPEQMKNMTPEEKRAIANKIMLEKAGMSLDEIQKLKTMSKEDREAAAKAIADEKAAKAQDNPQKNQAAQDKAKAKYEQSREAQELLAKFNAQEAKFRQQIDDLDRDPTAKAILENEIRPLEKKVAPYTGEVHGSAVKEAELLFAALRDARLRCCQQLSPKFNTILSNQLTVIKASLPDYKRFEELQAEMNKAMMGVDKPLAAPGLMGIQAIEGFVTLLKDIFKYDLIND